MALKKYFKLLFLVFLGAKNIFSQNVYKQFREHTPEMRQLIKYHYKYNKDNDVYLRSAALLIYNRTPNTTFMEVDAEYIFINKHPTKCNAELEIPENLPRFRCAHRHWFSTNEFRLLDLTNTKKINDISVQKYDYYYKQRFLRYKKNKSHCVWWWKSRFTDYDAPFLGTANGCDTIKILSGNKIQIFRDLPNLCTPAELVQDLPRIAERIKTGLFYPPLFWRAKRDWINPALRKSPVLPFMVSLGWLPMWFNPKKVVQTERGLEFLVPCFPRF